MLNIVEIKNKVEILKSAIADLDKLCKMGKIDEVAKEVEKVEKLVTKKEVKKEVKTDSTKEKIKNWVEKVCAKPESDNFIEGIYYAKIEKIAEKFAYDDWAKVVEKHPMFVTLIPEKFIDEKLTISAVKQYWWLVYHNNLVRNKKVYLEVAKKIKEEKYEKKWEKEAENLTFNEKIVKNIRRALEIA